jgi:hypothetical protein
MIGLQDRGEVMLFLREIPPKPWGDSAMRSCSGVRPLLDSFHLSMYERSLARSIKMYLRPQVSARAKHAAFTSDNYYPGTNGMNAVY